MNDAITFPAGHDGSGVGHVMVRFRNFNVYALYIYLSIIYIQYIQHIYVCM
jgi:hypothetical protein